MKTHISVAASIIVLTSASLAQTTSPHIIRPIDSVKTIPVRIIDRKSLEAQPYLLWNAFVDLLSTEDSSKLSPVQRIAQLAFRYDAEVSNGGHLQYFENIDTREAADACGALLTIGAKTQASILTRALDLVRSKSRVPIATREQFVAAAMLGEYDDFDKQYYAATPDMNSILKAYLDSHKNDFVIIAE
jgi:hypothetical protein